MPKPTYLPQLRELVDKELKDLREELARAEQAQANRGDRGARPLPPQAQVTEQLGERISQLERIQEWLAGDQELMRLVDSLIGHEVQRSERRQRVWSVILAVVSLIAGWLLSLVQDPISLLHHLGL